MRHSFVILLLALTASLYALTANAYVIHNNTGIKALFIGDGCPACFRGEIENRDTAACPGNMSGCRGNTTVIIQVLAENFSLFDLLNEERVRYCNLVAPKDVTAHGDVYAYKDHVVVKNDQGIEIYNGPWSGTEPNNGARKWKCVAGGGFIWF